MQWPWGEDETKSIKVRGGDYAVRMRGIAVAAHEKKLKASK